MYLYPCRNLRALAVITACLIFAAVPAALAEDTANTTVSAGGTIMVMSFPQGASVYLNDEYRGITPIKLEHIPPGKYLVNVSKAGANNDSAPVVLYDGSYREIGFTLESATAVPATPSGSGSIAVSSTPGGATVTLDGAVVGTTRLERAALILYDIPAGSHTVTVELAGYPAYAETVTVIKNQVVKVSADLQAGTKAPAVPGTTAAAASTSAAAPVSPLGAVAAAGLAGLAAAFRRS
jgi:hypothetical protein